MGGSQPAGNTTTTQSSTPWAGQQGSLQEIYNRAGQIYSNAVDTGGPAYFPGSTYQPLTTNQQGYLKAIQDTVNQGGTNQFQNASAGNNLIAGGADMAEVTPAYAQGQGVLANELDPNYLNPWNSPSFGTVVNRTLAAAIPAASSTFVGGNRSDSGLANRATTMAATDAVGQLAQNQYQANQAIQNAAQEQAAKEYETARGQQLQGISMAPQLDTQRFTDLATGLTSAGMNQQDLQNQIDAAMQRYNYGQMLPWNQLQLFENAITGTGTPGGTVQTSQPYFNNPGANIMSGISTIGGLGVGIAGVIAI